VHRIAVLALEAVVPLDLAIPAQVFGTYDEAPYQVIVCAERSSVPTTAGFSIHAEAGLEALLTADTVIVPGYVPRVPTSAAIAPAAATPPPRPAPSDAVLDALRAAPGRIVSICTGAFALAAAGLLDGRRATTHWRDADELARRYPRVEVDPGVLFIDDGDVLTSAGVASGLDLCLHILRRDHGAALAAHIARRIVVPPHRDGGQAQYVDQPVPRHADGSLAGTRAWALQRLHEPLTIADLAAHAHVSERTFARRFRAETGVSPLRWLLGARVDSARALLETTTAAIDDVAAQSGLGTAANLRKHFHTHVGVTPTAYRRTFRS
jgi:transcriptional regulator GlxA family with amidase domain